LGQNKPSKLSPAPLIVKESQQLLQVPNGSRFVVKRASNVVLLAVAFEAGLGVVAAALAQWFGLPLRPRFQLEAAVAARCVLAALPMLIFLAVAMRSRWTPLAKLRREVSRMVCQVFAGVSWPGLAAVSIAAGIGEELLFRGALQPLAERWWGAAFGLLAVSLLFGALHAMSWTYFVLAAAVGLYLGWLAQRYDELFTPIFVHALYDFAALAALMHTRKVF